MSHQNGNKHKNEARTKPILGYWDIRGLAQSIRYLLAYLEIDYTDKQYKAVKKGDVFDKSQWLNEKFNLGLDFPNIPYWIDGEIKLTESRAIMRHIARENQPSLLGRTNEEQRKADLIENAAFDIFRKLVEICYSGDEKGKIKFIEEQPDRLKMLSDYLGNQKWMTGENLSYVDFWLYEILKNHSMFKPDLLSQFTNLVDFCKNFENIPQISTYLSSDKFVAGPCFGCEAKMNLGVQV